MRVLFYYRESEQIGLEYISAVLKKAGHEVELLFDPGFESKFNMAKSTGFLKKLSVEDKLVQQAIEFRPDLIGFSSENNVFPYAKKMAAKLKKVFPEVPIIFGGVQATTLPEYVLKDKNVDMVCVGEGELAVLELITKMQNKQNYFDTKNIWFKKGKKIIKNEIRPLIQNLDSLPFPDRDLFFKYGAFKNHLMIVGSRGCPYNCTYCHNQFNKKLYQGKGTYVRRRSVNSIINEIKLAKKNTALVQLNLRMNHLLIFLI